MANIKSSKKRAALNLKQNARNASERAAMRTEIKKFEAAPSDETFKAAVSAIDAAKSKGLIHANKAARDKSRLAFQLAE